MLLGSQGIRYKCDVLDYRRRVFKDLSAAASVNAAMAMTVNEQLA
jgi:hypothetical protein